MEQYALGIFLQFTGSVLVKGDSSLFETAGVNDAGHSALARSQRSKARSPASLLRASENLSSSVSTGPGINRRAASRNVTDLLAASRKGLAASLCRGRPGDRRIRNGLSDSGR